MGINDNANHIGLWGQLTEFIYVKSLERCLVHSEPWTEFIGQGFILG